MLSHARGLPTSKDDLVVTRGSQQAVYLIAQALLSAGDVVAVEELGNPLVWRALQLPGAELEPVPVDEDGLVVSALEALLARRRLRAVYVTPHHQFPTNTVMSRERRARLAALARKHRFAIIEDDYDHEFHYEGRPVPRSPRGPTPRTSSTSERSPRCSRPACASASSSRLPGMLERLVSLRAVCDMQGDTARRVRGRRAIRGRRAGPSRAADEPDLPRRRDALAEALQRMLGGRA